MAHAEPSFDYLERLLRKHHFGVLSTVSAKGQPHSVGVLYGVSPRDAPFALYITTRKNAWKTRNIQNNPQVSFTVPIQRPLLKFAPPNCIQFQGYADILPADDPTAEKAFRSSRILKLTLKLERSQQDAIMIRIRPYGRIHTYGIGIPLISMMRNIESAGSFVDVPAVRR